MKRLLSYMKAYRTESILGPLFKMLEASFELFVPLVVASMIDVGIGGRDTGYVSLMGGFLVLLGVIGLACSLTAQYFPFAPPRGSIWQPRQPPEQLRLCAMICLRIFQACLIKKSTRWEHLP